MDTSLNSELPAALPSVVMAILSYKQEDRIGYAVDSVLAQDYEGSLTIILSDDCSPDGTFDIIKGTCNHILNVVHYTRFPLKGGCQQGGGVALELLHDSGIPIFKNISAI